MIYKIFPRPILTYCIVAWSSASKFQVKRLNLLQNQWFWLHPDLWVTHKSIEIWIFPYYSGKGLEKIGESVHPAFGGAVPWLVSSTSLDLMVQTRLILNFIYLSCCKLICQVKGLKTKKEKLTSLGFVILKLSNRTLISFHRLTGVVKSKSQFWQFCNDQNFWQLSNVNYSYLFSFNRRWLGRYFF